MGGSGSGGKPKPTKIKELASNPGRRPLNVDEPQYSRVRDTAPKDLDKVGRDEWNRISHEMRELGVITKMDETILFAYCDEFSTYKMAIKEMRKPKQKKLILLSPSGYPIQNPFLSIKRKSIQVLKGLASELGLSPASRSRVTAAPTKPTEDGYTKLKADRANRLVEAQERFKKARPKKNK